MLFSPDSRVLTAHTTSETADGYGPGELMRWDARTGRVLERRTAGRHIALIGFVGGERLP